MFTIILSSRFGDDNNLLNFLNPGCEEKFESLFKNIPQMRGQCLWVVEWKRELDKSWLAELFRW